MSGLPKSRGDFGFSICVSWDRALSVPMLHSHSHMATSTPLRRRLCVRPAPPHQHQFKPVAAARLPILVQVLAVAASLGQGLHATRPQVTWQAPGRTQRSPSAARDCCELSNASRSHLPRALSEESDYPAECYLSHAKQNLFTFFLVVVVLI